MILACVDIIINFSSLLHKSQYGDSGIIDNLSDGDPGTIGQVKKPGRGVAVEAFEGGERAVEMEYDEVVVVEEEMVTVGRG